MLARGRAVIRRAMGGASADDPRAARLVAAVLYTIFVPLAVAVEVRRGALDVNATATVAITVALIGQLALVLLVERITERIGLLLVFAVPACYVGYGLVLPDATDRLAPCLVLPLLWTALFMPPRLVVLSVLLNGAAGAFVEWSSVDPAEFALVAGIRFGVYATAAIIVHGLVTNIRAARNRFQDASRTLQETLLPIELPAVPGLEIAAEYRPSLSEFEVGGDFYDAFPYPGGRIAVWVGDVEGKGLDAGAVAGLVRHRLRIGCAQGATLEQMLREANTALMGREERRFATLAAAILTPGTGGVEVELVRAGHPPPVHLATTGNEPIMPAGEALGIRDDFTLEVVTLRLGVGEGLLFYTDGITEARRRGELFGEKRLLAEVPTGGARDATGLCRRLVESVSAFADVLRDDIAVLAIVTGNPQELVPGGSGDEPPVRRRSLPENGAG